MANITLGSGYNPNALEYKDSFVGTAITTTETEYHPYQVVRLRNIGSLSDNSKSSDKTINISASARYGFLKGSFAMDKRSTVSETESKLMWSIRLFQIAEVRRLGNNPTFRSIELKNLYTISPSSFQKAFGESFVSELYYGHCLNVNIQFHSRLITEVSELNRIAELAFKNVSSGFNIKANMNEVDKSLANSTSFSISIDMLGGEGSKSLPLALQNLSGGSLEKLNEIVRMCQTTMTTLGTSNAIPLAFATKSYITLAPTDQNSKVSILANRLNTHLDDCYMFRMDLVNTIQTIDDIISSAPDNDNRVDHYQNVSRDLAQIKSTIDKDCRDLLYMSSNLLENDISSKDLSKDFIDRLSLERYLSATNMAKELQDDYKFVFGNRVLFKGIVSESELKPFKVNPMKRLKGQMPKKLWISWIEIDHASFTPFPDGSFRGSASWYSEVISGNKTYPIVTEGKPFVLSYFGDGSAPQNPPYPIGRYPVRIDGEICSVLLRGCGSNDTYTLKTIPKTAGTMMTKDSPIYSRVVTGKEIVDMLDKTEHPERGIFINTEMNELKPDHNGDWGKRSQASLGMVYWIVPK